MWEFHEVVMRSILLFILLNASVAKADKVCGGYQSEDFGDRIIYTITEFKNAPEFPTYYAIQNPAVDIGLTLVRGLCYCVEGEVRPDLEFDDDSSYKVLLLESIISGPNVGCWLK